MPDEHDVVSGMTPGRPNPLRLESAVRVQLEKRERQQMAGAGGKEDAVWKRPLPDRVALCVRRASLVHMRLDRSMGARQSAEAPPSVCGGKRCPADAYGTRADSRSRCRN